MNLLNLLFTTLAFALPDPELKFQYVPNEGGEVLNCTHKRIRDLPDWEVNCGPKRFAAHVIIRSVQRNQSSSWEILYWVTARNEKKPLFHSTTARVHFAHPTKAMAFSLSQGVENDYASLVMELKGDYAY